MVGTSADAAERLLDGLKADFEHNDLLLEDFPEVIHPIRCLRGSAAGLRASCSTASEH